MILPYVRNTAGSSRGLTFVELLVAIVVASIFLLGIVGAISAVLNASQRAARRAEASRNARNALQIMSEEIAEAETLRSGNPFAMIGVDAPQPTGDFLDDDGDGAIDEEARDGQDNDGDAVVDYHALLEPRAGGDIFERPRTRTIAEISDLGVDEDTVFQFDELSFVTLGTTQRISYRVQNWEDRPNTLVRITRNVLGQPNESLEPIAFDIVSLSFLYYDPNVFPLATGNPWRTSWNSITQVGGIVFPATIHISITAYAGDPPLSSFVATPDNPMPTVTHETQVAIESVLPDYRAQF